MVIKISETSVPQYEIYRGAKSTFEHVMLGTTKIQHMGIKKQNRDFLKNRSKR